MGMGSEQTQRHLGGIGMTIPLRAVEQMRERLPGAVGLVPSSVCWWHMESPQQGHWGCLAVSWDWLRTWLRRAEHCPVGWGSPEGSWGGEAVPAGLGSSLGWQCSGSTGAGGEGTGSGKATCGCAELVLSHLGFEISHLLCLALSLFSVFFLVRLLQHTAELISLSLDFL